MNLFSTADGRTVTEDMLEEQVAPLSLGGRPVLVYSRLMSLGRFAGREAVSRLLDVIKNLTGSEGTVCVPTYTLNVYKEPRCFDFKSSRITAGILGEVAAAKEGFSRTIHPVYSNAVSGKHTDYLMTQNMTTCFGQGSFFELFQQIEGAQVLMIGLSFNGPTLYHYYDQKFDAKGRFLKEFEVKMKLGDYSFGSSFDSYVRDHSYYGVQTNCLARFDALADEFGIVQHVDVGDDSVHLVSAENFQKFYKAALEADQAYFLIASEEEWTEYYLKNRYRLQYGKLDTNKIDAIQKITGVTASSSNGK